MPWPPRKREYPKQLVINDAIYTVQFKRNINNEENTLGLCNSSSREIWIKLGQSRKDTLLTFIHEILHAIEYEYNFEIEHKIIYKLEKPIAQLLFDNFL